ncbi:MAG: MBL fold metallo-hydrolase [Vicingaceae bacterium]|nr:MBL fold metallo-hydrolase [Vicingaceae bacterium]
MKYLILSLSIFLLYSCQETKKEVFTLCEEPKLIGDHVLNTTSIVILGTIQDAGSPQIGCRKSCCIDLFNSPDKNRKVVSLGLIDKDDNKTYLFEATPDIASQSKILKGFAGVENEIPNGIFLTHAHIGHYTGLMYLGKEAMNADSIPVFAMPKMKVFLSENGPWSQLVTNKNISIKGINNAFKIQLSPKLTVSPILVPHRDEFSETVGYIITGTNKSALFIPDIDKWEKWDRDIITMIKDVDYAFLDGTFYDGEEINNRNISEIPHPFIIESMEKFNDLPPSEKSKIHFIHFNHTNPVINSSSKHAKNIINNGFNIASINQTFEL